MPRYTYVCLECEKEIESIHTLREKIELAQQRAQVKNQKNVEHN